MESSIAPPLGHRDGKVSLAMADSVVIVMPPATPTARTR